MVKRRQGRRDVAALEARRFEAARLFARGTGQAAVMRGLAGIESGGPAGPEAAARPAPTGPGGDGAARGPAAARLRHRSLDAAARRDGHRWADRGPLSSG